MGLDSSLYKKLIPPKLEHVLNRLMEEDDEYIEVLYWRKNHNLLNWFNDFIAVENCEYVEVSEEMFKAWLKALETEELDYNRYDETYQDEIDRDIEVIKDILRYNDFKKIKYYFYNWW